MKMGTTCAAVVGLTKQECIWQKSGSGVSTSQSNSNYCASSVKMIRLKYLFAVQWLWVQEQNKYG